jgi:isopropylmalate/homocitrate/citramalate synthase
MGWATPLRIERVLGEVRSRWPDMPISLHLHDTASQSPTRMPG